MTSDSQLFTEAVFFLNDRELPSVPDIRILLTQPGRLRFVITRELEGEYTCGRSPVQTSVAIQIVGK